MLKRLRELREAHGYTLEDVAGQLGLRNQYVSNYELGKRNPDYKTLVKFANLYDVSVDYLLGNNAPANETLDGVYLSFAKEAQENQIDPEDIKLALETIKKLRGKE